MADQDSLPIIASVKAIMSIPNHGIELDRSISNPQAEILTISSSFQYARTLSHRMPSEPALQETQRARWLLDRILACYGSIQFIANSLSSNDSFFSQAWKERTFNSDANIRELVRCFRLFNRDLLQLLDILER